ncbi:Uncharacterized conserved protein YeaO, DUF488 family [Evansella caseinilytica]|uniref:Uncharacterized conserved protein YeaO, DUF488 family n=1 Tax=Evansella caseinilytica TaxID=1503961 RepID=A0A1H3GHP8_9BACI|nr:DUF488 family protein [Evansella caseinilytica]SDY02024.1 Uncharacterized conserved protein YeaO, DUF488 family [Evansella caseinilytica]
MSIQLKRAYEAPAAGDGVRILVDRLWPRGCTREQLQLDQWLKEVAPSPELRKWFHHTPDRFAEFRQRYELELAEEPVKKVKVAELRQLMRRQEITLVYGAKDVKHNHAVVLKEWLERER